MGTSHASSGKSGKFSKCVVLDCMVFPFGSPTWMSGPMFVDGKFGISYLR